MNKEIINDIINTNPFGSKFGSEKYHIYICYGEKAIEECEVTITPCDTYLKVFDRDDESTSWIPYSKIDEIYILKDTPDKKED